MIGMTILYFFIALIVLLALYFTINLVKNRKKENEVMEEKQYAEFDANILAEKLSKAVQIPTVSMAEGDTDDKYFLEYQSFLEKTFPLFHKRASKTLINKYSILYHIEGEDKTLLPACFLAHQDVVPAGDGWEVDPFAGVIKDGYVYGRGSQDMKNQMIAILEAVEKVLSSGKPLKRGIYCCFGHDEEPGGQTGAKFIAKYLKEQGVQMEYVIDEGGIVLDGKMFAIDGKIALIGTCEKGYADLELTVEQDGGHASMPSKRTALGQIAEAVGKVETHPRKAKFTQPVEDMFDVLTPYMHYPLKFVIANRKLFAPIIKKVLLQKGMTGALVHTTFAPTMAKGSSRPNVLPNSATACINCRIIPTETVDGTIEYMNRVIKNPEVKITKGYMCIDPTPISPKDSDAFKSLSDTIKQVFPNLIPAPFLFVAGSDSRYYYSICENVFRFAPFELCEEDRNRIHSKNERCKIDDLVKAAKFFNVLIENTCL